MATLVEEVLVPARTGRGVRVKKGHFLQVIDVKGGQVGDMTCAAIDGSGEFFSPTHTVFCNKKIYLEVGDYLFSEQRNPLMRIVKETVSPHNLIGPSCDRYRYIRDFDVYDHANCRENMNDALREFPEIAATVDGMRICDAMHVFMPCCVGPKGTFKAIQIQSKADDYVLLEACADVAVVISACPQDLVPVNGVCHTPTDLLMKVWDREQ